MTDTFKGIITADGKKRMFAREGITPEYVSDKTLSVDGGFADAKATGNAVKSLKKDISNLSSSKISKFYATNNGENHLADSDDGKIADMLVYGRSEQKQYSGTNYAELVKTSVKGVEVVDRLTGTVKVLGQGTLRKVTEEIPAGTYTISYTLTPGDSIWVMVIRDSETKVLDTLIDSAVTLKKTFTANVPFSLYIGANSNIETYITINNLTLNKGNKALPFEPYTGGQPSPSPDYPQVIKSVVNPMVRVFGGTLGNKLNNKQINWLVENMNIWHDNNHFVLYDEYGTAGSTRLIVCNYENNTNNYTCIFIDADRNITHGAYQFDGINDIENKFIYCNMLLITDIHNISMVMDVDSNKTVGLPDNYQTIQYTLNAVPVSSGGNVTINGQQYVADYVDVERGKVVRMCERETLNTKSGVIDEEYRLSIGIEHEAKNGNEKCIFSTFEWESWMTCAAGTKIYIKNIKKSNNELYTAQELKELSLDFDAIYQLTEKQETDLTTEQTQALKALATYYPTTNISANSEQLDGYTVFNYPISMANGWNYVKQQLNDNRDYIYDMDAQSAEAYVNSEYAVALTELEV